MQGGVPREVSDRVDLGAVLSDPPIHPGQARPVVGGLVVRVRSRMRGMTGSGLFAQRPTGELHGLVVTVLFLADEREQAWVPPVVAVRRPGPFDDLPGLLRDGRHARKGDRGYGGREQERIGRVRREVPDQRRRVSLDVLDDRVHVAALALGAATGVQGGVTDPGRDVDLGTELVAQQRQRRMPESEGRVVRDRRGDRLDRALAQAQYVADAAVVGGDGLLTSGERESVEVGRSH